MVVGFKVIHWSSTKKQKHVATPGTLAKALRSWFGWQRGGRSFTGKPGRKHGHVGLGAIAAILKAHGTHCATGAVWKKTKTVGKTRGGFFGGDRLGGEM